MIISLLIICASYDALLLIMPLNNDFIIYYLDPYYTSFIDTFGITSQGATAMQEHSRCSLPLNIEGSLFMEAHLYFRY
jgi:hypothetical protein